MLKRIDNVSINVDDMDAVVAFFEELGMEVEGKATVGGDWVDRIIGLKNAKSDIVMMRTPDGHTKLELTKFLSPKPPVAKPTEVNTPGIGRIMFAVDDVDGTVARLKKHGGTLVGDVVNYENVYSLCYMRGPEGIIIALAQEL